MLLYLVTFRNFSHWLQAQGVTGICILYPNISTITLFHQNSHNVDIFMWWTILMTWTSSNSYIFDLKVTQISSFNYVEVHSGEILMKIFFSNTKNANFKWFRGLLMFKWRMAPMATANFEARPPPRCFILLLHCIWIINTYPAASNSRCNVAVEIITDFSFIEIGQ